MTELPASISARIRNAKILIEQGRDADAVGVLRMALALAPSRGEPRLLMAQALSAINRADEAESHLRVALEDPLTAGVAFGKLGNWLQARGRVEEATCCFERASALELGSSVSR